MSSELVTLIRTAPETRLRVWVHAYPVLFASPECIAAAREMGYAEIVDDIEGVRRSIGMDRGSLKPMAYATAKFGTADELRLLFETYGGWIDHGQVLDASIAGGREENVIVCLRRHPIVKSVFLMIARKLVSKGMLRALEVLCGGTRKFDCEKKDKCPIYAGICSAAGVQELFEVYSCDHTPLQLLRDAIQCRNFDAASVFVTRTKVDELTFFPPCPNTLMDIPCVQWCISHGCSSKKLCFIAARIGNRKVVEHLVYEDPSIVDHRDEDGRTLFFWAVWENHREVAQVLLDSGSDIDAKSTQGNTPFDVSCQEKHAEMMQWLVREGAKTSFGNGIRMVLRDGPIERAEFLFKFSRFRNLRFYMSIPPFSKRAAELLVRHCNIDRACLVKMIETLTSGSKSDAAVLATLLRTARFLPDDQLVRLFYRAKKLSNPKNTDKTMRVLAEVIVWKLKTSFTVISVGNRPELRRFMIARRDERDWLLPLVSPTDKWCGRRGRMYEHSPLSLLPWHLAVHMLEYVTICPIEESWGVEEFDS